MKSGSWSSYVAAGATGPQEPDDDPPRRTVPETIVPGQRFMQAAPHGRWDVYDWVCRSCPLCGGAGLPYSQPDAPACSCCLGSGLDIPFPELGWRDLEEADARLLVFGRDLLAVCRDALPWQCLVSSSFANDLLTIASILSGTEYLVVADKLRERSALIRAAVENAQRNPN